MNEIIQFFEIEKHDSIEEFEANFKAFNYENRTEIVNELLKLYKEYLKKLVNEKHNKIDEKFTTQNEEQISKVKKIIKYLDYQGQHINISKPKIVKRKITKEFIKNIDQKLNINTYDIILNLDESENKIDEITNLIKIYKYEVCKIANDIDLKKDLINLEKYCLRLLKKETQNITRQATVEFVEDFSLNSEQEQIKKEMISGKNIDFLDLKDSLYAYGNMIKYEELNDNIIKYAKNLSNRCISNKVNDDDIINAIYYIWDAIKYRLKNTDINRRQLKDIRILFDFVIENYQEDKDKTKHNYLFNLVDYLLIDENNYKYLKALVNELPKIVNVRHIVINSGVKTNESIIIYILKKYIESYQKLFDREKHLNKDYLKQVYLLFTRCYSMYLTHDEKEQINKLLSDFQNFATQNLISSKRKNTVKNDLKDMYTDNFYMDNKNKCLKNIIESKVEWQMNSIYPNMVQDTKSSKRTDLTNECSFTMSFAANHAYSIEKDEQQVTLKIHVIDLYNLIINYTDLDKYIYNTTIEHKEIDQMIKNVVSMKKNETYPTITYEIIFDRQGNYKNRFGHIEKFKMYLSKINVKEKYDNTDLLYSKGDVVLRSVINLYRDSLIKNHGDYNNTFMLQDIEQYFENILNQGIMEYFRYNKLPFIYSGIENKNENEYVNIMNNVGHILSRLEKEDFNSIYKIINSNVDEFHYTTDYFKGEYKLNIMNPLNYVGIEIQRIIHELILDNKNNEEQFKKEIKKLNEKFDELVAILNYSNDYVDQHVLRTNIDKLVKVKKMLY